MLRKSDPVCTVIEYAPKENRVMVRGIFEMNDPMPKKLHDNNVQNRVSCFLGLDMGKHVGFSFPEEEDNG
jgi:hypothetical protein